MGDEAARDITLTLSATTPLTAAQMQTAMDIVHKAFTFPYFIQSAADRKPTASLALLQKFQQLRLTSLSRNELQLRTIF